MEGEESERGQTDQTRKGKARQGKTGHDKTRQRERERERERKRESNPCPLLLFSRYSARAEWLEWWKGWPSRGGAFPLRSTWREGKREKGAERVRKKERERETENKREKER